jgi:hypothetical protein
LKGTALVNFENFHNQSLEEIVNEAKSKINYLNFDWNYQGESDPGITFLELFCWLKFVQHEYLNKISPMIILKFLKLLGINLKRNRGSAAFLEIAEVENEVLVPKNTKWHADELVFENNKTHHLTCARILNLEFKNPDETRKIQYYEFDGIRKFYLFGKNLNSAEPREMLINFDSPLSADKKIGIYFEIFNPEGVIRNPIARGDYFVPTAKIVWEYWGSEDDKIGWHKIEIADKTHNFLFSEIIEFTIRGKHKSQNGIYPIRARLLKSDYDFPPGVTKILLNVFEVVQKDTVCQRTYFKKNEISISQNGNASIKFSSHLALYGESEVYTKRNKSWAFERNFTLENDIETGISELKFQNTDFLGNLVDEEKAVMLVSYDEKFKDKIIVGSGKGFSPQVFEVSFNRTSLYKSFKLIIAKKTDSEAVFNVWKRVDDFFSSGKFDKCFIYDENIASVAFGDHEHGVSPCAGENNIKVCNLAFTSGSLSNIKKGMINSVESDNETLGNAWVRQITEARGGRDGETIEEARRRVPEVFSKIKRIVTLNDYKEIIWSTPGMAFKNISVFSDKDAKGQISVTAVIQCGDSFSLSKSCKKTIAERLEKYRLLGTKIKIIGPEPLGVSFYGKISVNSSFRPENHDIENEVMDFLNEINKKMGTILRYGDIFGRIDNLNCVSHIHSLNVLSSGERGSDEFGSGDIIAPPNAVYVAGEIDFNYIIDTN